VALDLLGLRAPQHQINGTVVFLLRQLELSVLLDQVGVCFVDGSLGLFDLHLRLLERGGEAVPIHAGDDLIRFDQIALVGHQFSNAAGIFRVDVDFVHFELAIAECDPRRNDPRRNCTNQERPPSIHPAAATVVQFLALTGWRKGEAEALTWLQVDLPRRVAILAETKSGRSARPLGRAACEVLQQQGDGSNGGLVFAGPRPGVPLDLHDGCWARIVALAGLSDDVVPHVLRHSHASEAADCGYADSTIAQLIGHKGKGTTSRYIHGSDDVLIAAADALAARIASLMS
jgi:integrase